MKCRDCPANSTTGCIAGVIPYQLRNGFLGCAWNTRIIKKHMSRAQTHYDEIRAMSVEEMADAIVRVQFNEGDVCPPKHSQTNPLCLQADGCRKCWINWLNQEAK